MDLWHLTFPLRDPSPRTRARWRAAALALGHETSILAFHVSDTHLHVLAAGTRSEVGRLVRRLELRLGRRLGRLGVPAYTPIEGPAHLASAFEYILRNDERHGVLPDPWRENSNLPDLLGLRTLAATTIPRVREHLERIDGAWLRRVAGFPALDGPLPSAEVAAPHLADLVAALLGEPGARGRRVEAEVRAAVLQVGASVGVRSCAAAAALGMSAAGVSRALRRPAPAALLRAARRQLVVRAALPLPAPTRDFGVEPARPTWRRR